MTPDRFARLRRSVSTRTPPTRPMVASKRTRHQIRTRPETLGRTHLSLKTSPRSRPPRRECRWSVRHRPLRRDDRRSRPGYRRPSDSGIDTLSDPTDGVLDLGLPELNCGPVGEDSNGELGSLVLTGVVIVNTDTGEIRDGDLTIVAAALEAPPSTTSSNRGSRL